MSEELKAAQARIACLEGEIAKRDETIARLEADNRSKNGSLKAFGEQIAGLQKAVRNRERLVGLRDARIVELEADLAGTQSRVLVLQDQWRQLDAELAAIKLYASPVSEAKAQGVVQWPEADEIMQMAFEEGQPADDASGYCFELEEFDLFIERLMSEVDRLNAAPVQQVSVPASAFASRAITHYEAALLAAFPSGSSGEVFNQWNEARRVLAAAPAAPAADACKACKGTGRRPIGGRGRIFGLTNRCFECQPLTDEEVYGQVTAHE